MYQQLWSNILLLLEGSLSRESITLWLQPLNPLILSEDRLVLEGPNRLHIRIVTERYLPLLERCARALNGTDLAFDFVPADSEPSPAPHRPRLKQAEKKVHETKLNSHYTFDSFVVGRCNKSAHSAAMAVVDAPGKKLNPLFITGGVGLGKTHLLQAIGNRSSSRCLFISSDRLMDELTEAIGNGTIRALRARYSAVTTLLIDDIHFLSGKEQLQEEFFRIFTTLYAKDQQIVFTSDRPPRTIPRLQKRLVARFLHGTVTELTPPDLSTRLAIMEEKARLVGATIPRKVLMLLASRIRTNIRRMEGAINKIIAYCRITGKEPDRLLVEKLIKDRLLDSDTAPVSIGTILSTSASHFKLKIADLLSSRRRGDIVLSRQVAMYLCRKLIRLPYADIGAAFSGRNHATVIHACRTMEELITSNTEFRDTLDEIETAALTGTNR